MQVGDIVRLKAFGGEEIVRQVVFVAGDHIGVCKEEEYRAAIGENREPMTVGFRVSDVIEQMGATTQPA